MSYRFKRDYDSVEKIFESIGFEREPQYLCFSYANPDTKCVGEIYYQIRDEEDEFFEHKNFKIGIFTWDDYDLPLTNLEDYFNDPLEPTKEEREMFCLTFGFKYPINTESRLAEGYTCKT